MRQQQMTRLIHSLPQLTHHQRQQLASCLQALLDHSQAIAVLEAHGDAAFAQLEKRILDRVLQKPDPEPEPAAPASWPGVPAHGLRWAV